MAKYYGYSRISSKGQSVWSHEQQSEFLQARALFHGLEFVSLSESKSGTNQADRPVFQAMIANVQAGDFVGVAYTDRFGRSPGEDIQLLEELFRRGVHVELNGGLYHGDSPEKRFATHLMLVTSGFFSANQKDKAIKGLKKAQETGNFRFRSNLYGFKRLVEGTTVTITQVPEEVEIIRKLFELYRSGMSFPQIADALHNGGYRARKGRLFRWSELRRMLLNPIYFGYYSLNPAKLASGVIDRDKIDPESLVYANYYNPPIVTPEYWWETFHGRRKIESKHPTYKKFQSRPFELTGLITCEHCQKLGRKAVLIRGIKHTETLGGGVNHYPVYTTRLHLPAKKPNGCKVVPKSFKAEILENLFRALLCMVFEDPRESRGFLEEEIKKSLQANLEVNKQVARLKAQIAEKERKRRNLVDLIVEAQEGEDISDLKARRVELNNELKQLSDAIEKARDPYRINRRELEKWSRSFSIDKLSKFFDAETTGKERRMIYKGMMSGALLRDGEIYVTFFNGKSFTVQTQRAKGKHFQKAFVVEVSYRMAEQEAILVEVGTGENEFEVTKLDLDYTRGDPVPLIDKVKHRDFDGLRAQWAEIELPPEDDTYMTSESLGWLDNRTKVSAQADSPEMADDRPAPRPTTEVVFPELPPIDIDAELRRLDQRATKTRQKGTPGS